MASKKMAKLAAAAAHKPLFRAFLAVSLDGYIADKTGGVGWLDAYHSPEIDFAGFMKTIGATIFGRTTYDWDGYLDTSKSQTIVLTRRPLKNPPPGAEAFAGDVRDLAARLRRDLALAKTGKDIWLMGGGLSMAPFHAAGLVDRWELGVMPVLRGEGIPLFPKHPRGLESLRLTRCRSLKNGIIEAWYEPAGATR